MSRIRILSEQLANQIAAGEVVERPASVVKELLENSLDAGATRVSVQVEGSGARLLRVADNGGGMDGDDVLLCIERHATSKLHDEEQLTAITTLGFRGEAIPSIGSVSWLTIMSRPPEQALGTRAEIRYGSLQAVHEDGCGQGTVIEVRHLFGNMPARKKFLKSARTEMYHIEEVVKNQALAHPQTGFSLSADGRPSLEYAPAAGFEQRVREVFRYTGPLLRLNATSDGPEILSVDGYLLLPETAPASTARLRILVNDRPVQDAMIRHAVTEGLQGFLMKGYQAAGAIRLTVAPDQVDVNVHPSKREIRFRQSETVHRFLVEEVRRAMADRQETLRTSLFSVPGHSAVSFSGESADTPVRDEPYSAPDLQTAEPAPPQAQPRLPSCARPTAVAPPTAIPQAREAADTSHTAAPIQSATLAAPVPSSPVVVPSSTSAGEAVGFAGLRLIGQLFSLYLLCEHEDHLVVIDQHAAHERLLYGQLAADYRAANVPRQNLLFPVTVELTPAQLDTMETHAETVRSLGLEADHFGEATYVIKAVPALVQAEEPGALLREVLDSLRGTSPEEGKRPLPQVVDDLLASMACKAAIKAGNRLAPEEMVHLLARMEGSDVFSHCPHGRPVIKEFSAREIEHWFHRHGG